MYRSYRRGNAEVTHRLVSGDAVTVVTYALKHRASGRRTALDVPKLALGGGGSEPADGWLYHHAGLCEVGVLYWSTR